jgi:hypothetical protein
MPSPGTPPGFCVLEGNFHMGKRADSGKPWYMTKGLDGVRYRNAHELSLVLNDIVNRARLNQPWSRANHKFVREAMEHHPQWAAIEPGSVNFVVKAGRRGRRVVHVLYADGTTFPVDIERCILPGSRAEKGVAGPENDKAPSLGL